MKFRSTILACLLSLSSLSCLSCYVPKDKRIDIRLENTLSCDVEVVAGTGFLSRKIRLRPGQVWFGWIPAFVKVNEIRVQIRK